MKNTVYAIWIHLTTEKNKLKRIEGKEPEHKYYKRQDTRKFFWVQVLKGQNPNLETDR